MCERTVKNSLLRTSYRMSLSFIKLLICAVFLTLIQSVVSLVTFKNNGYRDILVAIGDSVPEDPDLITNIKEMFKIGSPYLYRSTRMKAYFAEVTIIVPVNWTTHKEYQTVGAKNRFSSADIRIDYASPFHNNNPYTLQYGGCGDSGAYIHFTPKFIKQLNSSTRENFGPIGHVLVHEWAHFRYGVFDEYAHSQDTRTSPFYIGDDLQIHPTGCSDDVTGWMMTSDGDTCYLDSEGLPDDDCNFFTDVLTKRNHHIKGSIMDVHYLNEVDSFCDDTKEVAHNIMAPNRHNLICQGHSTWDIITSHADFTQNDADKGNNFPLKFKIVQHLPNDQGRIVLLLDESARMAGSLMNKLRISIARFILDHVPSGMEIAILAFSDSSRLIEPLTVVTDSNRRAMVHRLPRHAQENGQTGIGESLKHAISVLKPSGLSGSLIILITDGDESISSRMVDVFEDIKRVKVTVNTIALDNHATKQLEELATVTGGKSYFVQDRLYDTPNTLDTALFDSIIPLSDEQNKSIEVLKIVRVMAPLESYEGSVILDKDIVKRRIKISFANLLPKSSEFDLDITIRDPSNTIISENNKDIYKKESYSESITFVFTNVEAGSWKYVMNNYQDLTQNILVTVTAEPSPDSRPIRIQSWLNSRSLTYPQYARIYTRVSKGYAPVVRASVQADIDRPLRDPAKLKLLDNGKGADILANDGIYSGYFAEYSGNGRYSIWITATSDEDSVTLEGFQHQFHYHLHEARPKPHLPVPENSLPISTSEFQTSEFLQMEQRIRNKPPIAYTSSRTGIFQRSEIAGSFNLIEYEDKDLLPPGRVTDLKVLSKSLERTRVVLEWTSPGDDLYFGNATLVEIRYHDNSRLFRDFEYGHVINESVITEGSLVPLPSGNRQLVALRIPNITRKELEGRVIFFCLKVFDEFGLRSDPSNIARAYFPKQVRNTKNNGSQSGVIILATLGVVISILTVLVLVVKCMHWRKKRKELEEQIPYTPRNHRTRRSSKISQLIFFFSDNDRNANLQSHNGYNLSNVNTTEHVTKL